MSKEAQEEYAKIQAAVAHGHSIAQGRGNTGFYDADGNPVNTAGAISYNQQIATNNWADDGPGTIMTYNRAPLSAEDEKRARTATEISRIYEEAAPMVKALEGAAPPFPKRTFTQSGTRGTANIMDQYPKVVKWFERVQELYLKLKDNPLGKRTLALETTHDTLLKKIEGYGLYKRNRVLRGEAIEDLAKNVGLYDTFKSDFEASGQFIYSKHDSLDRTGQFNAQLRKFILKNIGIGKYALDFEKIARSQLGLPTKEEAKRLAEEAAKKALEEAERARKEVEKIEREARERALEAEKNAREDAVFQSQMQSYNEDMALYNMILQMYPGQTPAWKPTMPTRGQPAPPTPPPPPPPIQSTSERDALIADIKRTGTGTSRPLNTMTTAELKTLHARSTQYYEEQFGSGVRWQYNPQTTTGSGVFQTSYSAPTDRTGTKTTQDMIDYANSQAGQDEYQRHLETLVSRGQWKSEYEGHDVYELRQVIEVNAV